MESPECLIKNINEIASLFCLKLPLTFPYWFSERRSPWNEQKDLCDRSSSKLTPFLSDSLLLLFQHNKPAATLTCSVLFSTLTCSFCLKCPCSAMHVKQSHSFSSQWLTHWRTFPRPLSSHSTAFWSFFTSCFLFIITRIKSLLLIIYLIFKYLPHPSLSRPLLITNRFSCPLCMIEFD